MTEKLLTGTLSLNTNQNYGICDIPNLQKVELRAPLLVLILLPTFAEWTFPSLSVGRVHFSFKGCGGSVVECRTPEREVRGSKPTAAVLCP